MDDPVVSARDREILRDLARRKLDVARDPINLERRDAWFRLDAGGDSRVMVLAEDGGVQDAEPPCQEHRRLQCEGEWARGMEHALRRELFVFHELRDDHVVEPCLRVGWQVSTSDYGVQAVTHVGDNAGRLASRRWDPPLRDLDADFSKLKPRTFSVNRAATLAARARMDDVFGDLLPVQMGGGFWWTLGLTWTVIDLIGLEPLMLAMYDNPAGLHRLMAFLRDEALRFADWLENEGLLTLNNRNDYIGSGSMGYTRALPAPGAAPAGPVRLRDLWVLLESQETVGVGPEQFEEFIFPYQHSIAARFGRVYYGCCEPVHTRMHILERLPGLARVSVSPWADETRMAAMLGRKTVYSRKPNPSLISTSIFDERAIAADLEHTLRVAGGCRLEIIMKDVHTLNNEPGRLARWVALARTAAGQKP